MPLNAGFAERTGLIAGGWFVACLSWMRRESSLNGSALAPTSTILRRRRRLCSKPGRNGCAWCSKRLPWETFEVDLRTGEGRWNAVEFELLGLKPGDAPSVPATFFRYLHPDDAARVQAQWAEATQTGILNTEFRIVRADGQVRWLAGMGRFAYAGKPHASAPEGKPEP